MTILPTKLHDVFIITLDPKIDDRGYFVRTFCKDELAKAGIDFDIVQTNQSLTKKQGVIRGMHFQTKPKEEKKIVQCIKGKIFDVVINVQPKSPQYGQFLTVELSEENNQMLYIPDGFAHGFQTLTENCLIEYKMSEYFSPEHATGVAWNDPFFAIAWPLSNPTVSNKDNDWDFIK